MAHASNPRTRNGRVRSSRPVLIKKQTLGLPGLWDLIFERKGKSLNKFNLGLIQNFPTIFVIALNIILPFVQISIQSVKNYKTKILINPRKHQSINQDLLLYTRISK